MEAKYYTPEIEEFHVGFEYYFNDIGTDGENLYNENRKAVIKDGTQIDDITRLQDGKPVYNLFVKYLDRQDIEELGWEVTEDFGYRFYTLNGYSLHFYPNEERNIGILLNKFKIKNKSELKKLMKMLNIETK